MDNKVKKVEKTVYRSLIETSPMSNNCEVVVYSDNPIDSKEVCDRGGKLVFSRPVFQQEIDKGINLNYNGITFEEGDNCPDITRFIDSYYKFISPAKFWMEATGSIDKTMSHMVGMNFYDAMSGGCSIYDIAIYHYIIKTYDVSMDVEVYPGPDGWHTIKDFLEEIDIEKAEKAFNIISEIKDKLPLLE